MAWLISGHLLKRYAPVILVAVLGLGMTVVAALAFRASAQAEFNARLAQDGAAYASAVKGEFSHYVDTVRVVDAYLTAVPELNRTLFARFADEALRQDTAIRAIQWVPRVRGDQREAMEREVRANGDPTFSIKEQLDSSGEFVPASTRDEYYPVLFAAPSSERVGFDVASEPIRRRALQIARAEDRQIATGPVVTSRDEDGSRAVIVVSPVYETHPRTPAQRKEMLSGYAMGILSLDDLIRNSVARIGKLNLDMYLFDTATDRLLLFRPANPGASPDALASRPDGMRHWKTTFNMAGQVWTIMLHPAENYHAGELSRMWWVVASGILITVILTTYLADVLRRSDRQRRLTGELWRTNLLLHREIGERQRVEEHLRDRSHHLGQRVREINCLYGLSSICTDRTLSWQQVCQRAIDLLRDSIHRPESGFARLVSDGSEFRTGGFISGGDCRKADIVCSDTTIGCIELCYGGGSDDFLPEEVQLVEAAADRLGKYFERLRAEEALVAAKAEAEQANVAKSRFFAAASHDLRQPLQAMHLFLHILRQRLKGTKEREIADKLGNAMRTTNDLLDALLQVAKLDAGTVLPAKSVFPLQDLFTTLSAEYSLQASQKGLDLRILPSAAVVESDPVLLGRTVGNLLSNAIRYTGSGRVLVGARRAGDHVRIIVGDTGIGIDEHELRNVFQEFYQIGNPERDHAAGLGLGLAIVERMASLLGHRIGVRSAPGKGSIFWVEVPLAEAVPQPAKAELPADQASLAGMRVVVVENEPIQREGLRLLLEQWGCSTISAEGAEDAVAKLSPGKRPNLVLSDFRLRGSETGIAAIRRINQAAGGDIPGIILTGDTDPARLQQAHDSGNYLLHKPVDPERLRALMRDLAATG